MVSGRSSYIEPHDKTCEWCGASGMTRQKLKVHQKDQCLKRPGAGISATPAPTAPVAAPPAAPVAEPPAPPAPAPHEVVVGATDDYPGDDDRLEEEEPLADDSLPLWILIPIMILVGLALVVVLFRDKLRELINRKPPVRPGMVVPA